MSKEKRKISVFIASPGDVPDERKEFRDAIEKLNIGFGDGANIEFEALGWEDVYASVGRRNQSVINDYIDRCDVFIILLHERWGQESPDSKPYSSYTEEEFYRAFERLKKEGSPTMFVFFKQVDPEKEANPNEPLKKVINFRKQLEDTKVVLYRYINQKKGSFFKEVDAHLRAFAKGELGSIDPKNDSVLLPLDALEEVKKAKVETEKHLHEKETQSLKIQELQFEMALDASHLAKEG